MEILGEVELKGILEDSPEQIWKQTHNNGGISKLAYDSYFEGKNKAIAYMLGKVKKYENPVASVKVGNKTVPGSKFDADAYRVLNYSQFANKRKKITFNLKKGWSVQEVYYAQSGWMKSEDMQNGEIIKIKGGKGFQVGAVVVNDKTGQREDLLLWLK